MCHILVLIIPFLSTLSLRRATRVGIFGNKPYHISIHALLAESDIHTTKFYRPAQISIHALLAESDHWYHINKNAAMDFYPRSPCGERQQPACICVCCRQHFYPRSPCGERLPPTERTPPPFWISIHALLAESDIRREMSLIRPYAFLSTLSLRRATWNR